MPTGVYPRSEKQRKQMIKNLTRGRTQESRERAAKTLRKIASNPEWREKVSIKTREAMHRPDVRKRHLAGIKKAIKKYGVNFKGGNGQEPVEFVKSLAKRLEPLGYVMEFAVRTKGHSTNHKPPSSYKVDFGREVDRIAIEVDGPSHKPMNKKKSDKKKQEVLESLGWTVLRVNHK